MKEIYLGASQLHHSDNSPEGKYIDLKGETYFCISDYDQMPAFFMTLVSSEDHWLFISSRGGLSAGRKNPEHALFPYYTDDKIHDSNELTGSKTLLLVEKKGKKFLWEPFSMRGEGNYKVSRNLYKNIWGNRLIFEEVNHNLKLTFQYSWGFSREFGFVRRSELSAWGEETLSIKLMDGLQNLLPYGVDKAMQMERSTLLDAYKKNELDEETGLGLYMLSSIPVDRPEPSEALKASSVWSVSPFKAKYLLSARQMQEFRLGKKIKQEIDIRAERGAYFVVGKHKLKAGEKLDWHIVAEINQGPVELATLKKRLHAKENLGKSLEEDIASGTKRLKSLISRADGLQVVQDQRTANRHLSNVLFNNMRGGVFLARYVLQSSDLLAFLQVRNTQVFDQHERFLSTLPPEIPYLEWVQQASQQEDPQLLRLAYEYLPLTFSRRHGDPSRPWNFFSIELENDLGEPLYNYQGNWRDIFQNWEALAYSYPEYAEGMIHKFLNATTADGYNPYRITREGIDWEVTDPHDPWSFIGYWGDHQIIYLLKLLELSQKFHPSKLKKWLNTDLFAYANVPYRIKSVEELLANPHQTIDYDDDADALIQQRVAQKGSDGKLIWNDNDQVVMVNIAEKILVPLLAKLANFIPEGGIWMNTQRPEWNDANNALVGYGVSMVTLYYLRRYLAFCKDFFGGLPEQSFDLSEEVATWLGSTAEVLHQHKDILASNLSDQERLEVLFGLGRAAEKYRQDIYDASFSGKKASISTAQLGEFFIDSLAYMDHSIVHNRREDGLYHAYNLLSYDGDSGLSIGYLYEMLEGQVAVLSAGVLSVSEVIDLLETLKKSKLYREDQHSYMLYPDRRLPRFFEKNKLSPAFAKESELIQGLLKNGHHNLVEKDLEGNYHFASPLRNADLLSEELDQLVESEFGALVEKEKQSILEQYELVFDHRSFTGRSGTFYGYEGLGSIYWHMVSKLLLAVQENYFAAIEQGESEDLLKNLAEIYYEIQVGIGAHKSPADYGAFPTDPYSHTPGNAGAQQPGMTGQVKEDILARFGELGIHIEGGMLHIIPQLLRRSEFLLQEKEVQFTDVKQAIKKISLPPNSLAFTYCQVPIVYYLGDENGITVHFKNQEKVLPGLSLGPEMSRSLFAREGRIKMIEVHLDEQSIS